MTSTHSGSPLPVAAAIACVSLLKKGDIIENARRLDPVLREGLQSIQQRFPDVAGRVQSLGLVGGVQVKKAGSKNTPDSDLAFSVVEKCFQKGLLMFSPVGIANECVKIAPPLTITEDALKEGIGVLHEAFEEALSGR
jgi:4-aminobutyrate aminotransferase/(S)-3-amino-2-methylpropionate transaminase